MPTHTCPICVAVDQELTEAYVRCAAVAADFPDDHRLHILAAIGRWWVRESLQDPQIRPEEVVQCVANILKTAHQVEGTEQLTAVRLSRTPPEAR